MFALIALIVAAIAWAFQAFGDGLDDPWAWIFAVFVLYLAHVVAVGHPRYPTWANRPGPG